MHGTLASGVVRRLVLAAVLGCAPTGALAQSETPTDIEVVIVTGSRIPTPGLASASPLTELGPDEIRATGTQRIEDVINQLPQAFADQSSTVNNGATGTATVDLRGVGAERTLVLIDGKRVMPGDPTSGSVAPDLNLIPDALVDHIEIVTGGASAVYGSDAIAGVVNFIMKRDFTGVQIDLQAGMYNHANGETAIQSALGARNYAEAPANVTDGFAGEATVIGGLDTPDGRGNVTVYAGYRRSAAVTEDSRDFSACSLLASGDSLACTGSTRSTALGRFLVIDAVNSGTVGNLTLDPAGPGDTLRTFNSARDGYNFAPAQYFIRPDERYTSGVYAHYRIDPAVELYADGMFMYDDSTAQLAPSGLFSNFPFTIACSNPLLSAAEVQAFCTNAHVPPGGSATVEIGHRDVEGEGRQDDITHLDYRLVTGARGEIDGWRYDISAQRSAVAISQTDLHDVSLTRAADALNVVRDASGQIVCASGNPGCVPYDLFRIGGVTPEALAYLDVHAKAGGGTRETVLSANVTGDLGRYGIQSPWAANGASVAFGAEYRREGLSYSPDAELASGDLASAGVASPAVRGAFDVTELYGEVRVPLLQDRGPLLHDVTLSGGYRYSQYSNAGGASTYKAGLEWSPMMGLGVRAGFNHAVRAPNVVELFTPVIESFSGLDFDPCAGSNPASANPFATAANCARTGVTAAQYGQIVESPDDYNVLNGGNPKLAPESADTKTIGIVVTPDAITGFSLAVDYFNIKVMGVIGSLDPDLTLEQCLETGAAFFCGQVHRAPGTGSLWLSPAGYVSAVTENSASLGTQGFDMDVNYLYPLPAWSGRDLGSASVRMIGTYLMTYRTVTEPGALPYDCAGFYGFGCGDPAPRWRHTLDTTWKTPWDFDVSVAWRYVSAVKVSGASTNPILASNFDPVDYRLGPRSYIDMSLDWRIDDRWEVRAGVRNLFDIDPPIVGNDFLAGIANNSNTYPGVYDALGRWLFTGLTARL